MGNDIMGLEELATYLARDVREVTKMASRGQLPGRKVAGEWRFARVEINHWIEANLHVYTAKELTALETGGKCDPEQEPILKDLLNVACVGVPLTARTRSSVLRELVGLAEQSWQVYDPDAILDALRQREERGTTALGSGVAIPHPHRPLPNALGESVVAYGRTTSPIPFGGDRGGMTDLFFLVCCTDDRIHLRTLARLSRLIMQPGFLDRLREVETAAESFEVLVKEEAALITPS